MSSQPEEETEKKTQTSILFRKTKVLGFNVPNVLLLLIVVVIAYVLCKDSDKKYTTEEILSMQPLFEAFKGNSMTSTSPPSAVAPVTGQSGGFFGKSNKFQFDY